MTTEAVRRALDASGARPLRVRDAIVPIGAGYAAAAYRVRTATGDRVLRLPRPPLDRSSETLRREVAVLRALARVDLGAAVPGEMRPIIAGGRLLGTVHRYVEGAPLPLGLRGAVRERACLDIGRFLARLHGVPEAVRERSGLPSVDLWRDVYRALIAQALPHLGPAAGAWLVRTGEAFAHGGGTRRAPRVLIHGDIQRSHLLTDADGRLTGVIDFGNAMIGDPALDFAGVLNHLGWRDLERVWAGYRAAGGTVDADAARRTRFYIDVVPLFRVLYGEAAEGPAERRSGQRAFAARAAAATRAIRASGG